MSIISRLFFVLAIVGCASDAPEKTTTRTASGDSATVSVPAAPAATSKVTVLFFGTSLTAGYGLDPSIAFPNLIARKSDSTSTPITAINGGLSGETSAGALRRIDWALRRPVDIVVVETGGNDALRALDPDSLEANLQGIIERIKAKQPKARILLATMESPPNLGPVYNRRFREAYSNVAKREKVMVMPFLLDKVAGIDALNQADAVHPNEKGERIVADNVWKALEPLVREVYASVEAKR